MSCEQREGWGRSGARVRASSAGNAPLRRPKCSSRSPLSGRRPGAAPGAKVRAAGRSNCVGAASSRTIDIHAHAHTMHAAHTKFVRRTVQAGCFAPSKTASMRYFRRAKPLPRRQTGGQGLRFASADIVLKQGGHRTSQKACRASCCQEVSVKSRDSKGERSCSVLLGGCRPWHPSELAQK